MCGVAFARAENGRGEGGALTMWDRSGAGNGQSGMWNGQRRKNYQGQSGPE